MEQELRLVNAKFGRLHGYAGPRAFDLYGRVLVRSNDSIHSGTHGPAQGLVRDRAVVQGSSQAPRLRYLVMTTTCHYQCAVPAHCVGR